MPLRILPGCVVGEANRAPSLLTHMVSMRTRTPTVCGLVSLFSRMYFVSRVSRRRFWPGPALVTLLGMTSIHCVTLTLLAAVYEACIPVRWLRFLVAGRGLGWVCGAELCWLSTRPLGRRARSARSARLLSTVWR